MSSSANKWGIPDYVKAKVNEGVKAAQIIEYLMEKFSFQPQLIMRLEFGFHLTNAAIVEKINEGQFDFMNINEMEARCEHIKECQLYIPAKQDKVKIAIATMMQNPHYRAERMVSKLKQKGGDIYPTQTTAYYIEQLQKIYNHGLRAGKVYFL